MPEQMSPQVRLMYDKAKSGDAQAQFHLGKYLLDNSLDEALLWMGRAAGQGLAQAHYLLGVWHTEGTIKKRELKKGLHHLEKAEEAGIPRVNHYRAVLKAKGILGERDWAGAISEIIPLAKTDNPFAVAQLAFLLEMTGEVHLEETTNKLLHLAAYLKNPEATKKIGVLDEKPAFDPAIFDQAAEALKKPPKGAKPEEKVFSQKPKISVLQNVIPSTVADYLTSRALPVLERSFVIHHITKEPVTMDYRTSTELRFLPAQSDLVAEAVCYRIADLTGLGIDQQEILGVLRYEPGQEYKPHSDFLRPNPAGANPEVERSGQRIRTFLIYLNEEFTGGETEFPKLGLRVKGQKGDGVVFDNVTEDGRESLLSFHAGRPVETGEKFITTLWIRDREYTYPRA